MYPISFTRHTVAPLISVRRAVMAVALVSSHVAGMHEVWSLPRDEREAAGMLAEGSLDSAVWSAVRPYYLQPLSVPGGDLRFLPALVPEIDTRLPLTDAQLAKYEPWNAGRVAQFFRDYPHLTAYQPILDFTPRQVSHLGTAHLRLRQSPFEDTVALTGGFDVGARNVVRLQGALRADNRAAAWQRRTITANVPVVGTLQVGSFSRGSNSGLVTGYFPSSAVDDSSTGATWLYGEARSWNGALLQIPLPGVGRLSTFVHARPTERVAGVGGSAGARNLSGAIEALVMTWSSDSAEREDTAFSVQGCLTYSRGAWRAGCNAAIDHRTPGAIPWTLEVRHEGDARRLGLRVTRIPRGYLAPRSSAQRSLSQDLTRSADTLIDDITAVEAEVRHSFASWLSLSPRIAYVMGTDVAALDASVSASGTAWLDYRVRLGWQPGAGGIDSRYSGSLAVACPVTRTLVLFVSSNAYATSSDYASVRTTATGSWNPTTWVRLAPYLSVRTSGTQPSEWTLGVSQILDLFERTRGEVTVGVPCGESSTQGAVFSVQTSFFF